MIRALSDQNVRSLSTLPNSQEELWTRAVSPPSKDRRTLRSFGTHRLPSLRHRKYSQ